MCFFGPPTPRRGSRDRAAFPKSRFQDQDLPNDAFACRAGTAVRRLCDCIWRSPRQRARVYIARGPKFRRSNPPPSSKPPPFSRRTPQPTFTFLYAVNVRPWPDLGLHRRVRRQRGPPHFSLEFRRHAPLRASLEPRQPTTPHPSLETRRHVPPRPSFEPHDHTPPDPSLPPRPDHLRPCGNVLSHPQLFPLFLRQATPFAPRERHRQRVGSRDEHARRGGGRDDGSGTGARPARCGPDSRRGLVEC